MQSLILDRSIKKLRPREFTTVFTESLYSKLQQELSPEFPSKAHGGAVNSLSLETNDYRYLLSGGADGHIKLWDVKEIPEKKEEYEVVQYQNVGTISKKNGHDFGVSCIQWWPFDTGMFVSGSFDHTVKIWDTNQLSEVYSFDMDQRVYAFDLSPTGTESLVAVASDQPFLRLLDIRTTSSAHTLTGHKARILSVKWSPTNPYMLASGGSEGEVLLWDIRRSGGCVCRLDMHRTDGSKAIEYKNSTALGGDIPNVRAHTGPVNGLVWTENGTNIITTGNDQKIRVWDLAPPGAVNKLVNFGPLVRNKYPQNLTPCLSPFYETELQYLLFPSDSGDVFVYSILDGKLVSRLRRGAVATRTCSIVYRGENSARYICGTLGGEIIGWGPNLGGPKFTKTQKAKSKGKDDVLDRIHHELEARKILHDGM